MGEYEKLGEFLSGEETRVSEETPPDPAETPLAPGQILRASELPAPEDALPEIVPEGGVYRGFRLVSAPRERPEPHRLYKEGFYVTSPRGLVGFVPWVGAQVIWPWEAGWAMDLHRTEVESFLRPEPKKKAGR